MVTCKGLQDREWSRVRGECRDGKPVNSYALGFWDGVQKVLDIPKEEVGRIDGQEDARRNS